MTKLTYGEQLRHPNWQRLRLERLDAAGWKCQACGDTETTLHVHHKRYIKGRMAWEYPADNFAVLCEQCHGMAHETRDDLMNLLGWIQPIDLAGQIDESQIVSLLYGLLNEQIDFRAPASGTRMRATNVGYLARVAFSSVLTVQEISELGQEIGCAETAAELQSWLALKRAETEAEVQRDLDAEERRRREGDG